MSALQGSIDSDQYFQGTNAVWYSEKADNRSSACPRENTTEKRQRPSYTRQAASDSPPSPAAETKSASGRNQKKSRSIRFHVQSGSEKKPGSILLSHRVSPAVPSAQKDFTSVFGMGTGVAPSASPPGKRYEARTVAVQCAKSFVSTEISIQCVLCGLELPSITVVMRSEHSQTGCSGYQWRRQHLYPAFRDKSENNKKKGGQASRPISTG